MNKLNCILIDIDGTLANIDERRKAFIADKDWDLFYSKLREDLLNKWCNEIIERFKIDHQIILLTGRRNAFENETLEWLKTHNVFYNKIFFRGRDDYRSDEIVKKEILDNFIRPNYQILFVIDDRKRVVDMWRKEGLVCLHCAEGEF